jgi:hypothetical protein
MNLELITLDKKDLEQFENLKREFDITKIEVEDDKQFQNLAEMLKKVKGKAKEIEDYFKEPKSRAYLNHRTISGMEKEYKEHLMQFETLGKKAIGDYVLAKEEQNTALNPIDIPKVKGVNARDKFIVQIVDFDKVPDEYKILEIDVDKIRDIVNATNGTIQIPGITITKEKIVSVRANG